MSEDRQAWLIKLAAVVTATPRWVAALLAAEGLEIPATWLAWWLPASALFSAGMAVVEGLAFAFVFSAWRNQRDRQADRLLWLAILSAIVFVGVLAPYIAASVQGVRLAEILSDRISLLLWSSAVGLSTIVIVVSVGYAQKSVAARATEPEIAQLRSQLRDSEVKRRETEVALARAEVERKAAEARFAAAGDLMACLVAESKRERILAAARQWPQLTPAAIAVIAAASPSYVSEVLVSEQF
jgi:hypothetical protein